MLRKASLMSLQCCFIYLPSRSEVSLRLRLNDVYKQNNFQVKVMSEPRMGGMNITVKHFSRGATMCH